MSVSISPPCSRRCAHRGGGGAGDETEGDVLFLCQAYLPTPSGLCTFAHPSSNLWGKRVENAISTEKEGNVVGRGARGGAMWTFVQRYKGTVDWQCVQPPSLPIVPVRGAVFEI